jgi:UMF1 family MFS transporter
MVAPADQRSIFGWCIYDWANSAYATTVLAGLLPAYFADGVVGEAGYALFGKTYSGTSLWGFAVSAAALIAFMLAPVLGAIADYSAAKKRFLLAFAYGGSLFTTLLVFCASGDVIQTLVFFILAQIGFVCGNVFYDAFLPRIAAPEDIDRVSGRGYAFGYVGGGLQFAVALGVVAGHESIGISQGTAARIGLGMAGVWWAGFTVFTAVMLRETTRQQASAGDANAPTRAVGYISLGIRRTWRTVRHASRYPHLLRFLVAFMLYNDGIQTVIVMATIYGKSELQLETSALMITLLIIQAVAMVGALVFSRLAARIGTKRAILVSLAIWSGIVVYAYFINTQIEYFTLGVVVGLVLGGSQALSRSYYGSMIPPEASAEFYGFYTVFSKFSAIWGPLQFALIDSIFDSTRLAIVSLIVFFVGGMILLALVDETQARALRAAEAS